MMSQDSVAIDSVCLDIWQAEKAACGTSNSGLNGGMDPTKSAVDDYMIEAALANAPWSGTTYNPSGVNGARLASLGTHEHWKSPSVRLYSRNLGMVTGAGAGIELVTGAPVSGRWIFYNNCAWDGNDAAANSNDDHAIAPDKTPLLPGGQATFLNYTSYDQGINGIMVDVAGVAAGQTPTFDDFEFRVGNDSLPGGWTTVPPNPGVTLRRGEGINGSDRITLIWTGTNAVKGQWLKVRMKANTNKNLPEDVFYVGNAPGDTGDFAAQAHVDVLDELNCRHDPHNVSNPAALTNNQDFTRDKHVDLDDILVSRHNATNVSNALNLITVP
jgi:hypothetical protein